MNVIGVFSFNLLNFCFFTGVAGFDFGTLVYLSVRAQLVLSVRAQLVLRHVLHYFDHHFLQSHTVVIYCALGLTHQYVSRSKKLFHYSKLIS